MRLGTGSTGRAGPALRGRANEQAVIDSLLGLARAGQGGCLVLHGEPGIGKTALLGYAVEQAAGVRVLHTAGAEPEAELRYATLHRLLLPVLDRIGRIPGPQADSLAVVFGRRSGAAPEPFLVALAALSLLSQVAADRPVLCLVDDAQWADPASLAALTVAARRLAAEPIALLLAARPDACRPVDPAGLGELPLGGLEQAAARVLLVEQSRRRLSVAEQDALLPMTGGNPLAIRELAATGWRGGPAHEPVPLPAHQQRAFLDRVRGLDPARRQVLLLVAVAGAANVDTIQRAAGLLGVDAPGPLVASGPDELVVADGPTLAYRHPLVRSAVYHAASPAVRRAAHRALAAALTPGAAGDPDRRAWHLGQAADRLDEPVAAELERCGERARWRTGPAAAAVRLERAAELSATGPARARRLVAAGTAWWQAGDPARSRVLLGRAEQIEHARDTVRPEVAVLQAQVAVRAGLPSDAVALLLPVVRDLLRTGGRRSDGFPAGGVQPLLLFGEACAHARPVVDAWYEVAGLVEELPPPGRTGAGTRTGTGTGTGSRTGEVLVRLYRAACRVPSGAEAGLAPGDLTAVETLTDPAELCWAGGLIWTLGDPVRARRLRRRAVVRARAVGAAGTLAWTLGYLAGDELGCGRFGLAEQYAQEGLRLARETGQPNLAYQHQSTLALVAALRGREQDARGLADTVLAGAGHRLAGATATAHRAVGLLELAARRPAEALAQLAAIDTGDQPTHPEAGPYPVPELVEAAVRAGRPDLAGERLKQFTIWADTSGAPDLLALAARSQALLQTAQTAPAIAAGQAAPAAQTAPAGAVEAQFRQALALHAQTDAPIEQARTELLFGEHLRRARRRFDARPHLRAAFETFRRLGAPVWADRARAELRAAGECEQRPLPGHPPPVRSRFVLTPQEQRIAAAVSEGATNREIATRLFLSPRTVDYHLRKIFQKTGLSSRTELIRLTLTSHRDAPPPPRQP